MHEWEDALDDFYDEHEYVNTDAKARSAELFMLDEKHENDEHSWHVRQIIDDSDGDHDWAITGTTWTRRNPAAKSSSSTTPSPTTDAAGPRQRGLA